MFIGLYNLGNNILSREKAEKDLRKLLNRPPSGQSSKSQNPNSSNSGVVPGLMNPVQPGPGRQTSPPGILKYNLSLSGLPQDFEKI